MLQIRKSTFETNSSSMHCIVLAQGSLQKPSHISADLDYINDCIYAWTYDVVDSAEDKIAYLIYHGADREILAKVVKDFCGCELYVNGCIIYQNDLSSQIVVDQVNLSFIKSEESLIEFIFNSAYKIYFGNDNCDFDSVEYNDTYEIISIDGNKVVYTEYCG